MQPPFFQREYFTVFPVLAYSGFHSTDFAGMFLECLPRLAGTLLPVVLLYIICSAIAQFAKWRWLGIPIFIVAIALLAQSSGAMGECGPAHIAAETFGWAAASFFCLLFIKTVVVYQRASRLKRCAARAIA